MDNREVRSRSRSRARPLAPHAVAAGMRFEQLPSSVLLMPMDGPQGQMDRERSRSPIKGRGKRKDKGKGKGQPKGQGKGWHMNAIEKNSGFKKVNFDLFECFFGIDIFQQTLWLVPLAVRQMTNPVYVSKPAHGAPHKQILPDLSHSPDCDGIMAIGPLEIGTVGTKEFICANVRLSTGEEGWINVAMSELSELPRWSRQWTIYLKVCAVDRSTPIPYQEAQAISMRASSPTVARAQWLDHPDEYRCVRLLNKEQGYCEEGSSTLDSECSTDSEGRRIEDFLPEDPEYMQFLKRREAKKKKIYEAAKRSREKAEEKGRRKSIRQ